MNTRSGILKIIRHRMRQHVPADELLGHEPALPEAAVLICIIAGDEPSLLLTRRSHELKHHAGEVAFPGGKTEKSDRSLIHTALREAKEEVGLKSTEIDVLGQLSPAVSLHGYKVTPVVGMVAEGISLAADENEIAEIFTIPLREFLGRKWVDYDLVDSDTGYFEMPYYLFEGHRIWGLTSIMITDFINQVFDEGITLEVPHYHPEALARLAKVASKQG